MTSRYLLPALVGGLFLAPIVSAQSLTGTSTTGTPIPTLSLSEVADVVSPSATASSPASAPSSRLAACTSASVIANENVTSLYGFAPGTVERGQSITAPCEGFWTRVRFVLQHTAAAAGQTVTGTFRTYSGAGTAGTVLSTQTVSLTLSTTAGAYSYDVTFPSAVAVAEGQVYTWFYDLTSGPTSGVTLWGANNNPYAGGDMYFTSNGDPASARISTGADQWFDAFFGPAPSTVSSPAFFNPTSAEGDGAGWRLLSSPVSGVSVNDLATQNLVQGFAAAGGFSAQYPDVESNILVAYTGAGYLGGEAVAGTNFTPRQGTGYYWYFYDQAITPPPTTSGGGTSTSRELTGFTLSATGVAPDVNVSTQYYLTSSNGVYMLGNPFAQPFQLSGLSETAATGGTIGTVFQVWQPTAGGMGSYVLLGPTDFVARWQGFFATSTTATGTTAPTFTYAIASTNPAAAPTFYGRSSPLADAGVQFTLDGQTTGGATLDRAAQVRFLPDALAGADRHDGAKLLPPGDVYALLAPVDAERRLAVSSLSDAVASATVPVAFTATHGGTFTLSWTTQLDGQAAQLRDLATGDVVDLQAATEYVFTSDATDWSDRFELVVSNSVVATETGPQAVALGAAVPNPTTGTTALTLRVDAAQTVRATLVDALGRQVAVVFEGEVAPSADVALTVDGARLAPGVYSVRVQGATFVETRQVTVTR